jgi:tRNA modification GTPase
MQLEQDTIVAIATPPGRGGIGLVRLSGASARAIAAPLYRSHDGRLRAELAAGRARFAEIVDEAGAVLDEAVVTYFAAPHSYTSEDVVEIAAHGSPVLLDWLVRAAIRGGARLAQPGEFTQRAFLSGRLDLTQAEAVNDLIAAQTLAQARLAAAQLGGSVAKAVAPIKQRLIHLIAELEAGVDFAEDDLDLMPQTEIATQTRGLCESLEALAATYSYGRIVREGFTLAIVGRPNAGKSSLFNRLLERERAIVTAQPGTTRDVISERLSLSGVPVELIDTAGLRDVPQFDIQSEAETLGIERSRMTMAEADFVLHVVDATVDGHDAETAAALAGRLHRTVLNKCDLIAARTAGGAIYTSATTGEGLDELKQAILADLTHTAPSSDSALVTNLRQHEAVEEALAGVTAARDAVKAGLPHELVLLDLHAGLQGLDRLTGATSTDDILGLIFSQFCIGK